ncbi:DUF3368 domain-containing protein [Fervidibacter sacchari]
MPCIGTVGVLLEAKAKGLVTAVKPILDALRVFGFYLSDELYKTDSGRCWRGESKTVAGVFSTARANNFPKLEGTANVEGVVCSNPFACR